MSVVDVFSFFIYQPAKIGSTIKVRTARVKCQRPAWPTASLLLSALFPLSRERDTRWTVPVGQFCYRSSECSLLPPPLSLSCCCLLFHLLFFHLCLLQLLVRLSVSRSVRMSLCLFVCTAATTAEATATGTAATN